MNCYNSGNVLIMTQKKSDPIGGKVIAIDDGLRLEVWLARNIPGLSRNKAIEAIRNGEIWIDGRKAKKGNFVATGNSIEIRVSIQAHTTAEEPTIPFKSKSLIITNKPAGMPCHALRLGETGTLLQWIGEQFPEILKIGKDVREGGLLHRLDKDTSGCVAFARDQKTYDELRPKFLEGGIGKIYLAIVTDGGSDRCSNGGFSGPNRCTCCSTFRDETKSIKLPEVGKSVVIKIPLGRHPSDAGRMVPLIDGEEPHKGPPLSAKTTIRTLAKGDGCALVEATIERGRMHQIRVHLAAIGNPIVGEKTYGGPCCGPNGGPNRGPNGDLESGSQLPAQSSQLIGRQALHAYKLIIDDIETTAPIPEDFKGLCAKQHISIVD